MAVQRPFLRVEVHLDARAVRQLVAQVTHVLAVRAEERQRCSRPREHAHIDPLRRLGEEPAERRPFLAHSKRWREDPAGELEMRFGRANVVDHPRQHLGPVDEELDLRARARCERAVLRPPAGRRVERASMPAPVEAARVMGADRQLDTGADRSVESRHESCRAHRYCGPAYVVVVGGAGGGGGAVVVVAVEDEYDGTYEYGEETVCPVNCGYTKSRAGSSFTAADMKRFQIIAGSEPPKTALQPSTL